MIVLRWSVPKLGAYPFASVIRIRITVFCGPPPFRDTTKSVMVAKPMFVIHDADFVLTVPRQKAAS